MLWEAHLTEEVEPADDASEAAETASMMRGGPRHDAAGARHGLVDAAAAAVDRVGRRRAGRRRQGRAARAGVASGSRSSSPTTSSSDVESFDSGTPDGPTWSRSEQDGPRPDA